MTEQQMSPAGIMLSPLGNRKHSNPNKHPQPGRPHPGHPHSHLHSPSTTKICGFIPKNIHGDLGCIWKPLSCIKYWMNPTVTVAAIIIIWYVMHV